MQMLTDVTDYLHRDSMALADSVLACPYCGRKHTVPFGSVHIGTNLVGRIPEVAEKILGRRPQSAWLLYDRAIEEIVHGLCDRAAQDDRPAAASVWPGRA